jgi:hypothetical protein
VEPKLSSPVHRQLLHDLWKHRPSDRYSLLPSNLPVLLLPTGAKSVSPFSACKLADVQEAIQLLQLKQNSGAAASLIANSNSVTYKGNVEPIHDVEYVHTSSRLRVRWLCKPGHDAPVQYASAITEILIDNYQDGFLSTTSTRL